MGFMERLADAIFNKNQRPPKNLENDKNDVEAVSKKKFIVVYAHAYISKCQFEQKTIEAESLEEADMIASSLMGLRPYIVLRGRKVLVTTMTIT
jgi:hypothetical protein